MTDIMHAESITSAEALRAHYGEPPAMVVAMIKTFLDEHHQNFIRHSPFVCVASAAQDGQPNVSPKGDAPGFVHILDRKTLVIPDRPGNSKVESFENVIANPKIALIFFIPGITESLRVQGTAKMALYQHSHHEVQNSYNTLSVNELQSNILGSSNHSGEGQTHS